MAGAGAVGFAVRSADGIFLLGWLSILAVGCSASGDFASARAKWRSQNLATYRYTYQAIFQAQDAQRPLRISVVNEQVLSAFFLDDGQPIPDDLEHPSIDGVFESLQDVLSRGAAVDARYDYQYGFPLSAKVVLHPDAQVEDDEYQLNLSDLSL